MIKYRIPKDTAKLFETKGLQSKDIDNFSLRLNRFVRIKLDSKDEYKGVNLNPNIDKNRVDKYYDSLEVLPYEQDSIFVKNDWKLTLGMGSSSVYNTSMTLHHIYGVPYIPAQSIKGAFRSYIVQNYFTDELFSEKYKEKYSKFEEEVLYKCNWFVDIFGSNDRQGKVLFFDAFSKDFKIIKDIMTPHYGEYYGDKKNKVAPTDTQKLIPITFLAVENASFKICFASKENYEIEEGAFKGKKVLEMIEEELTDSLEVFGIGGKTSVGYGYFDIQKSEEEIDFNIIKDTKNIAIIEAFIDKYSKSKYVEKAKEIRKNIIGNKDIKKWESVLKVDKKYKRKALEDYINKYPNSPKIEEAKKELKKMGSSKPKVIPKGLDFSQAKDAKSIERAMKFIQNPADEDKEKLEEVIKKVYPDLNANKKRKLERSKLIIKWLGKDRVDKLLIKAMNQGI